MSFCFEHSGINQLMGDMNCNLLSPNRLTVALFPEEPGNEARSAGGLNLITEENNLKQLNFVPARTTGNSQTLIDLLFSS